MKIIDMPIGDVIPYKNNPRRNDAAVKPVMESLKEFGWKQLLLLTRTMLSCVVIRVCVLLNDLR